MHGGFPSSLVSAIVAMCISSVMRIVAKLLAFPKMPFMFVYSIFSLFIFIFVFFYYFYYFFFLFSLFFKYFFHFFGLLPLLGGGKEFLFASAFDVFGV